MILTLVPSGGQILKLLTLTLELPLPVEQLAILDAIRFGLNATSLASLKTFFIQFFSVRTILGLRQSYKTHFSRIEFNNF